MLRFETILHPTDFSRESDYAFELACRLAADHGASLVLMHVIPPPAIMYGEIMPAVLTDEVDTAPILERMRQMTCGDRSITYGFKVERGDPATCIADEADTLDCDLIVMGSHGRSGFSRALMGSVSEAVQRKARCPVLSVKSPFMSRLTPVPYSEGPARKRARRKEWPVPLQAPSEGL